MLKPPFGCFVFGLSLVFLVVLMLFCVFWVFCLILEFLVFGDVYFGVLVFLGGFVGFGFSLVILAVLNEF